MRIQSYEGPHPNHKLAPLSDQGYWLLQGKHLPGVLTWATHAQPYREPSPVPLVSCKGRFNLDVKQLYTIRSCSQMRTEQGPGGMHLFIFMRAYKVTFSTNQ